MSTFVSVGNATQPFERLLRAVSEVAGQLPQPVFMQFGAAATTHWPGCTGVAFMDMAQFEERVKHAELLILHAGAGSVIHALRAGKVPIVVARRAHLGELVDDHQLEFARELEQAGRIVTATDAPSIAAAAPRVLARQRAASAAGHAPSPLVDLVARALRRR